MRKKYQTKRGQKAFTLLELLIVMLIIGLLAALGLSSFVSVQQKSRDSRRKQDLAHVAKALELYYNDWGTYPDSEAGTYKIQACGTTASTNCTWGELWDGEGGMIYMSELPSDPSDGLSYAYQQLDVGDGYYLFAHLENANDPDVSAADYSGPSCGGVNNCNYVLRSSNVTASPITQ